MKSPTLRKHICYFAAFCAAFSSVALRAAAANDTPEPKDTTIRLEEFEVSAPRTSAITAAPTESRLNVTQPESVINLEYIANSVTPTADYATIANLAPSVSNVETNGPGLSESKHLTMRGFDDNSYNVTYDGIPFGDINDFSHHTTSYFPAKMIGQVVIDRGPGTASTIGEATFGGTMALYSKDPRRSGSVVPTTSYGSWNTFLGHLEANTGTINKLNGASAIASAQYIHTDGYRTHSDMWRRTYYLKYLQPVGTDTTLTFLANYNDIKFNNPGTVKQTDIDTMGRNYGLTNDPTRVDFVGYNYQAKQADMYYLGLDSHVGDGWRVQNKTYTYAYNNESHEKPKIGTQTSKTDIFGNLKVNRYRSWGDYLLVSHEGETGTFKAGAWIEWVRNPRYNYNIDYNLGYGDGPDGQESLDLKAGAAPSTAYSYDMVNYLKTAQPFVEYDWHPTSALTVNAGVKYVNFTRQVYAPINQTTKLALFFSKTTAKTLPSISANYRVDNSWSFYAQAAKGFLAPNLNQFYVPKPQNNHIAPEESKNYQIGTVFKTDRFNADIDAYWIDFSNFPITIPNPDDSNNPNFAMASGAYYSGIETQLTFYVGRGLSIYGNGSLNQSKFKKSKLDVNNTPDKTAALGFVYSSKSGFFASLVDKYAGPLTVYSGSLNPDDATTAGLSRRDGGYWMADLSFGFGQNLNKTYFKSYKLNIQVNNLMDRKEQVLDSINGSGVGSFNVLPTRNYFATAAFEF